MQLSTAAQSNFVLRVAARNLTLASAGAGWILSERLVRPQYIRLDIEI